MIRTSVLIMQFDLSTELKEVREADRGRTLQAEGTARAEVLRWSRKKALVTEINKEKK